MFVKERLWRGKLTVLSKSDLKSVQKVINLESDIYFKSTLVVILQIFEYLPPVP